MLLRSLHILDPDGPHHQETVDLRIQDGHFTELAGGLTAEEGEQVIDLSGCYAAPGFLDLGTYLGDPGHEDREDIASLTAAAAAGGFVAVAPLPDTLPVRQSVADLGYLRSHNGSGPIDWLPLAALSQDLKGKDLTEMLELHRAGAVAFTDGPHRRVSGSLLKRALEYAKATQARVMVSPYHPELIPDGQIHEGLVSTRLGLRGIPTMSETIPLKRDLELLAYTEGRLIVHLLSSAEGVEEVRRAKAAGHEVFATVSAHHLLLSVEALSSFDTHAKMLPPLREESDRLALIAGLKDGTIDAIVSNHQARHGEEKDLEFLYADFGARGIQTAFNECLAALGEEFALADITEKLGNGPRRLLGLPALHLRSGAPAKLSIFRKDAEISLHDNDLKGKTVNNPVIGRALPGKIIGTVNNGQFFPAG
ncbi:dihydroorotase [Lewinella sp. W8]|uniref:dihydroorotase n=1 Tax=Lewinella sp. W8 TaxID=2528208 RepID=UPI001067BF4C|nr:dihydroorotase [Lewinella sp. W8]MTB49507.1 dihydroorotase [Lewinella sp. W8]